MSVPVLPLIRPATNGGQAATLERRRFSPASAWVLAGSLILAAAAPALLILPDETLRPVLIGLSGIVTLFPIAVRVAQRRWDPFEPVSIMALGCFVLFFMRPTWMWMHDQWGFPADAVGVNFYDTRDGLILAATIGIVGCATMWAAYFSRIGSTVARKLPSPSDTWRPERVVTISLVMFAGAAFLFLLFIGTEGGFGAIERYFSGREYSLNRSLTRDALGGNTSSAYFYLAPYATIPITLLMIEVWRRRPAPHYRFIGLALIALVFLMTVPRGDRLYILALLLPIVAVPYINKNRRPRLIAIAGAILAAILVANALVEFRAKETRDSSLPATMAKVFTDPLSGVDTFMLGADVSMFSVLAAESEVIPGKLGYKEGQALTSTLLLPVPGMLWPGKPEDPEVYVHEQLFPHNASVMKAGFTPSMFGGFYADSGLIGVVLYSLLVGVAMRILFEFWNQNRGNRSATILYAALLPLLIVLLRANLSATVGLSLFLILPIPIAFWWGARRRPGPA